MILLYYYIIIICEYTKIWISKSECTLKAPDLILTSISRSFLLRDVGVQAY